MKPRTAVAARVRRRVPVVLACIALTVLTATLVGSNRSPAPTSWVASALLVVPPDQDPGRQARNYTVLLRNDTAVLERVTKSIGGTSETVRGRLALSEVGNTTLLRVSFRDLEPTVATAGLNAFVAAVTAKPSLSPAITEGSLIVVSQDPAPTAIVSDPAPLWPIATGLGLLLGLVLSLALDRGDTRVDRPQDLVELGVPVTEIRPDDDGALAAALTRWVLLLPTSGRLALIAPQGCASGAEREAARHVLRVAGSTEQRVELLPDGSGASATPLPAGARRRGEHDWPLTLMPSRLGPGHLGAVTAVESDGVILVVARGMPLRHVQTAVTHLRDLGVPPLWCLIVRTGRRNVQLRAGRSQEAVPAWSRTG